MFGIWINRFRIFASRATVTPDKASHVIMATFRLKNLLRLKSRDSYTPKGSVDEIQCNESFL